MNTPTSSRPCSLQALTTGTIVVALAATGALLSLGSTASPPTRDPQELAVPVPRMRAEVATSIESLHRAADAVDRPGVYTAAPGTHFEYRVDDRSFYGVGAASGEVQEFAMHYRGTLGLSVIARTPDSILTCVTFPELEFIGGDGVDLGADPMTRRFLAAASKRTQVQLGVDGVIRGYRFARDLDGEQRNFLRGIIAPFAFTVPVAHPIRWDSAGADATGEFVAAYESTRNAEGLIAVSRRKLRYSSIGLDSKSGHQLEGSASATFDPRVGWMTAAHVDETLRLELPIFDMTTSLHRVATWTLADVRFDAAFLMTNVEGPWAPASGHREELIDRAEAGERARHAQELRGVDLNQLVELLRRALASDPFDSDALTAVFQDLQWLVRLDPAVGDQLEQMVLTRELRGDVAGVALSALAAVGTPAAQATLVAVRSDRSLPLAVRDGATVSLLQVAEPTPQLLDTLAADSLLAKSARGSDLRIASLLVLGALAPRARAPLADGRSPFQALLDLEAVAGERGETPAWLQAIGNSGMPAVLPIAARYLGHADPRIRAAACEALEQITVPAATAMLVERGLGDTNPQVRRQAVRVLGARADSVAIRAVGRTAVQDLDEDVRREAVTTLAWTISGPLRRELLTQVMQNDPAPALRAMAQSLLAPS